MSASWYVRNIERGHTRPLRVTKSERDRDGRHIVAIAPDGRHAIVDATPDEVPEIWMGYGRHSLRTWIGEARASSRSPTGRNVHQLHLVELTGGQGRPLWNAPAVATITQAAWSPDSRSVLIAPTATPLPTADARGLNAEAAVILDVRSGRFEVLPVSLRANASLAGLRFIDDNTVELIDVVAGDRKVWRFRKVNRQWRKEFPWEAERVRISLREDLQMPPVLIAEDVRTGDREVLLDLNPQLRDVASGKVEKIARDLPTGERWSALLFYPVNYCRGARYPLVIQSTYASPPSDEFTLYGLQEGGGLGPAMVAPYAARSLAGRGIAVLHLNVDLGAGRRSNTPAEPESYMRAYEHAAQELSRLGLVDRTRVGLMGFSRNGFYVEYALTQSGFPFAAALAADHWGASYMQTILTGHVENAARVNGAMPYAEGLQKWFQLAPGFNVHRVRTPLLIIEQSHGGRGGVLAKWELFSRLRSLGKPVEMYVMPEILHGSHTPQNPRQILAVQERSIDWFDFWLNGREDVDPKKHEQYERWRALRRLQTSE
jgi:dipeptidyl aminopeptidase/acylaminoacyl peptidase